MKTPSPVNNLVLAGAVAAVFAVGSGGALALLSAPPGFESQVSGLDRKVEQVGRMMRARGPAGRYPKDAVCTVGVAQQQQALRAALANEARAVQLDLSRLDVSLDDREALGETLAPIRVSFQGKGSYEAAVATLQALARMRPLVFADAVDLTSNTSSVTLAFSGRVFCTA